MSSKPMIEFYKERKNPAITKYEDHFDRVDDELIKYFDKKDSIMQKYLEKNYTAEKELRAYKMLAIFAYSQSMGLVDVNWAEMPKTEPDNLYKTLKYYYEMMKEKHPEILKKWDDAIMKSAQKDKDNQNTF